MQSIGFSAQLKQSDDGKDGDFVPFFTPNGKRANVWDMVEPNGELVFVVNNLLLTHMQTSFVSGAFWTSGADTLLTCLLWVASYIPEYAHVSAVFR